MKQLKKRNNSKINKLWTEASLNLFPKDFESQDDVNLSNKFIIIANLLEKLYPNRLEKVIIVSYYT